MPYSKVLIDRLLGHVCIVEIMTQFLPLKQRGRKNTNEYVVLCPFHSERTPSCSATKIKQFYHCFGCGAHGNAITFIMEFKHVDFCTAVKELAQLSNFSLPNGKLPSNKKIRNRRKYRKKLNRKQDKESSNVDDEEVPF